MTHAKSKRSFAGFFFVLMLPLFISACGGGGGIENGEDVVATLSWEPPTENTDGSELTDLQGFYVYIGESPSSLKKYNGNEPIPADKTSYAITSGDVFDVSEQFDDGNGPVTVYFAVTAFSLGGESDLSEIVSKTF